MEFPGCPKRRVKGATVCAAPAALLGWFLPEIQQNQILLEWLLAAVKTGGNAACTRRTMASSAAHASICLCSILLSRWPSMPTVGRCG